MEEGHLLLGNRLNMKQQKEPTGRFMHFLSTLTSRLALGNTLGETFGGTRDTYAVLGYKKEITFELYLARYERYHIASRIVSAPAKATWKDLPVIIPLDNMGEPKKAAGKKLSRLIRRLDKNTNLRASFERADRISGIGRYGIIVVGIKDNRKLSEPAGTIRSIEDILYFTPYAEGSIAIKAIEGSPNSPRYGLPTSYEVRPSSSEAPTVTSDLTLENFEVHHSRVIHVAEDLLENQIYGRPRLEKVYNLFDDLAKVVGGSAEFFWRIADRGMQFDLDKDTTLTPAEEEAFEDDISEWIHGLKRFIQTRGVTAKSLGAETSDPRGSFNPIISLIAGASLIPQRVLMGSERGQLSSSQDRASWDSTISNRQDVFAEPVMVRPLISMLIRLGAIPNIEDYEVEWPLLTALTRIEEADIAQKKSLALVNYARHTKAMKEAGSTPVMSIEEFRATLIDSA